MAFIYSDLNPFFPTRKPLLEDVAAIHASLFNLFNTRKGEVLFRPDYGIDLEEQLFELMDDLTALEIFRQVVEAVSTFEQRVTIDVGSSTLVANENEGRFDLVLVFNLQGEEVDGQSFEFRGSFVSPGEEQVA